MTSDTARAAQEADAFLTGKRKSDDAAAMLSNVLRTIGIRVGDEDSWPWMDGRASWSGEPSVFLGTVPLQTVNKLIDVLIRGQLLERKEAQRALGYDD
ncbi:hypothetical protein [Streptomyces sp. H27-D2]|uniref:hypothetical protein n=1 Tax=Streptomyces sp. H27-D2 TaxID=3046304 RepID=UPI002DB9C582|nr:hypothetical protein [Streptomyces sp. H27-D2]MEC4018379.1 hypothetical protein [Streptomyces sp. H27-D2]